MPDLKLVRVLFLVIGFHVLLFIPLAIGNDSGWSIDIFCQHGGVGKGVASSPPFFVGDRIFLFAYVTYNQAPVPSVLVAFQVDNPQGSPLLTVTAQTNKSGIATTNFTITENVYPMFPSTWASIATASPSQQTVIDTMAITILSLPSVGGISTPIPASDVHTYTSALFVEILITLVATIVLAKVRKRSVCALV